MKVWTKDEIKGLIVNRDDAVIRGMLRIYDLQTESEKVFGDTHAHNGVGFSGVDGEIMSSFSEFVNNYTGNFIIGFSARYRTGIINSFNLVFFDICIRYKPNFLLFILYVNFFYFILFNSFYS